MRTANTDSLRLQVLQEVMELTDEQLLKLYNFLSSLSEGNEEVLYHLLNDSANEVEEGAAIYSIKEVMNDIDKEMGW